MIELKSGQTYDGKGAALSGYAQFTGLRNVTLQNYLFNDGQLKFTDCENVRLLNNIWNGVNGRCVDLYGRLPGFVLTGNAFNNCAGDSCVFCTGGQLIDAVFSWNRFNTVTHGMHLSWGLPVQRNDVKVFSNTFKGVLRMALEMQNGVQGLKIFRNYAGDFRPNTSRMAYSIATGPSDNSSPATQQATYAKGVEVFDNWFGPPVKQGSADAFCVCELMGDDSQFHHNAGWGDYGTVVLYGWSRKNWKFYSNRFNCNPGSGFRPFKDEVMGVAPDPANVYDNNMSYPLAQIQNASVDDVLNGRAWFQTTAGGAINPAIVINTDPNAPAMTAEARANAAGVIDITLKNTPAGTVQRRPTRGTGAEYAWVDVTPVVAGPCSLADVGPAYGSSKLPANWEIDYQLVDVSGKRVVGVTAQVGPLPVPEAPATTGTAAPTPTPTTPVVSGVNLAAMKAAYQALGEEIAAVEKAMARQ